MVGKIRRRLGHLVDCGFSTKPVATRLALAAFIGLFALLSPLATTNADAASDIKGKLEDLIGKIGAPIAAVTGDKSSKLEKLIADPDTLGSRLAKGKFDPNSVGEDGVPALIKAIQMKQLDSFKALLNAGARPEMTATDGTTAWYHALVDESGDYLSALQELSRTQPVLGGEHNAQRSAEQLLTRGLLGPRVATLLNARDFNINARDSSGKTILERSILSEDYVATDAILDAGGSAKELPFGALAKLAAIGSPQTLHSALLAGADPNARNAEGKTILFAAVEAENLANSRALLANGAKPEADIDSFDTLTLAILKGLSGMALALLEHGANADRAGDGIGPVDAAQLVMDAEVLAALAVLPPNPSLEVTSTVRRGFAEIGVSTSGSQLPWDANLTAVVKRFQARVGLPAHGHPSRALRHVIASELQAPFLRAAAAGDAVKVNKLRQTYPELVSASDANGWDALMHAAYSGHVLVVEQLLAAGASTTSVDRNGSSALLLATISQDSTVDQKQRIVAALLRSGADPAVANKDGASPARLAQAGDGWLSAALNVKRPSSSGAPMVGIFGRPINNANSVWCQSNWDSKRVKEQWDKGLAIADLAASRVGLCVVMGRNPLPFAKQETYVWVSRAPGELSRVFGEQKDKGLSFVDIAESDGKWLTLFSNSYNQSTDGYFLTSLDDFGAHVKERVWNEKHAVSNVVVVDGRLLVIYGGSRGFTAQSYTKGSPDFVLDSIRKGWGEGRHVTNLVSVNGQWLAVMSEGSEVKDQVIVAALDWQDFKSKAEEKLRTGWRLQSIVDMSL